VAPAQLEALAKWGAPRANPFDYLKTIHQPTLVINGGNDVIVYTINSYILQQNIPNAQLILYPDANHGSPVHPKPTRQLARVRRGRWCVGRSRWIRGRAPRCCDNATVDRLGGARLPLNSLDFETPACAVASGNV